MTILLITCVVAVWFLIWGSLMGLAIASLFKYEHIKATGFAFAFFFVLCLPLVYLMQGAFQ